VLVGWCETESLARVENRGAMGVDQVAFQLDSLVEPHAEPDPPKVLATDGLQGTEMPPQAGAEPA